MGVVSKMGVVSAKGVWLIRWAWSAQTFSCVQAHGGCPYLSFTKVENYVYQVKAIESVQYKGRTFNMLQLQFSSWQHDRGLRVSMLREHAIELAHCPLQF